ncbi:chitinase-like protein PB1E7.04c [Ipomoea triloba]|uniref:chitinase-like protein PB1E7.04c n=1 Tax=Ipomoea triloba TaxID=35885 RepID=UPI00125DDC60|nr:chitinase-like protein PB1E7.04c [Ipomoea triloba]XP_031106598.1 chitinase-like protein PB1E7.04c [Ipomoea triloba]
MQFETKKKKKKTSFSYKVVGENLKLIDISSEDDFLIASPLFDSLEDLRLSVTWDNSKENEGSKVSGNGTSSRSSAAEELLQRQQSKPSSMESGRPSYLRKSLAWDKAFFTSAGVLDADELSLISNGACQLSETQQDVRARRPEGSSNDDHLSVNSILSSKEDGISSGNMIKSATASKRDPINIPRLERTKTKINGEFSLQSVKPPKVLTTKMKNNVSSGHRKTGSVGGFHAKMQEPKTARTAQALLAPKKSASGTGSSCSTVRFSSSTPTVYSSVSSIPKRDSSTKASSSSSTILKNKSGSRKTKLCTSVSTSLGTTHLKNLISFSIPNQPQYKSPPASSTKAAVATSPIHGTPTASNLSNLQTPRFISQETISTPSQLGEQAVLLGPAASSAASSGKPSSLRLPSPKIGFFDEVGPKASRVLKFEIGKASKRCAEEGKSAGKALKPQAAKTPVGTGKLKNNVSTPHRQLRSCASFRLASKHGGIHSPECDREIFCKSRKLGAGEHERRSVEVGSGAAVKSRKKRAGEVSDLSRRLELIDLWDDLKIDCQWRQPHGEKSAESPFCSRTPLADKTRICNVETKKTEKPLSFPSSQSTDKENI